MFVAVEMWLPVVWLILILLGTGSLEDAVNFKRILNLYKDITEKDPQQFVFGALLSVEILKVCQRNGLEKEEIKEELDEILDEYRRVCDPEMIGCELIRNPGWIHGKVLKAQPKLKFSQFNPSMEDYLEMITSGHPNESDSEICFKVALNGGDDTNDLCAKVMDPQTPSFGYQATHKLIYHILTDDETSRVKICESIAQEVAFIWRALQRAPFLGDLFMEQIVICRLLGFQEFLNTEYFEFVQKFIQFLDCPGDFFCTEHTLGVSLAIESLSYCTLY